MAKTERDIPSNLQPRPSADLDSLRLTKSHGFLRGQSIRFLQNESLARTLTNEGP